MICPSLAGTRRILKSFDRRRGHRLAIDPPPPAADDDELLVLCHYSNVADEERGESTCLIEEVGEGSTNTHGSVITKMKNKKSYIINHQ